MCKCLDCVYYITCDPDSKSKNLYGEICEEFEFLNDDYLDFSYWYEMSYYNFVETGLDTEEEVEELEDDKYKIYL